MAVSETSICNRALQRVGASRITDLTEDSKNARECAAVYEIARDAELRAHPWSFAVKRAVLAPSGSPLVFEDGNTAFPLPSDFLRLLPGRETRDWQIEGRNVLTKYEGDELEVRYVARIEDTTRFDPLFVEALSARIAHDLVERLTQSNTKKQLLDQDYVNAVNEARRANAIERPSAYPPTDSWIEARIHGGNPIQEGY